MPRQSAAASAAAIWNELQSAPGSLDDLVNRTGMTRWQVRYGMKYCNQIRQEYEMQPIIWNRATGCYELTDAWPETTPWVLDRMSDALRRLLTEIIRIKASEARFGVGVVNPHLRFTLDQAAREVEHALTLV